MELSNILGVGLHNGYLKVDNYANYELFKTRLNKMTILAVQDIPVRGISPDDLSDGKLINILPTVDLAYASAVPYDGKYGNGNNDNVRQTCNLTIIGQYIASLRVAL